MTCSYGQEFILAASIWMARCDLFDASVSDGLVVFVQGVPQRSKGINCGSLAEPSMWPAVCQESHVGRAMSRAAPGVSGYLVVSNDDESDESLIQAPNGSFSK